MADTLTGPVPEAPDTVPEFLMSRAARRPFDPPPALKELQEQAPLTKVRLWDGSETWLVTRYDEQHALQELLRYLRITHLGRRRAVVEDIEIAGQVIKAGEGVINVNEIADRDPEIFPDPDRLDLARGARRHVAFGVHRCLGRPPARRELQVVYGILFKRIPTLKPAVSLDDVRFRRDAFSHGVHSLSVTW